MPHFPLDDAIRDELPSELSLTFDRWRKEKY